MTTIHDSATAPPRSGADRSRDRTGIRSATIRQLSAARRAVGKRSFRGFAETYLARHFNQPASAMHLDLFARLERATVERGLRLAIAAPRGHAKSTIVSLAYILWCICYAREPYILLISDTVDQASDLLSLVKNELENNELILADFPEISETPGLLKRDRARRWRKEEIITRGPDGGVKVTALGADKKLRGRKHKQHRPSLIIIDDLENETDVRSPEQRQQRASWFNRAVLKAGTATTNIVVVGTVTHYDALLTNLIDSRKSPGWTGIKYRAVISWSSRLDLWDRWQGIYCDQEMFEENGGAVAASRYFEANREPMLEGTDVLWPEREDYYELMKQRLLDGRFAFDCEKQNEPVNPEECYFQEHEFRFWDDEFESADALIRSLGAHGDWFCACDPSLGKAGRNADDTAIIGVLRDRRTRTLYIIDADIRRRRPSEIIDALIEYHRKRNFRRVAIETNQYQEFLADEVRRRGGPTYPVPVFSINHTSDKCGRIQRLQPLITMGTIRFSRRHVTLLDQLRQFPFAAHDDGPDALEMAVEASRYVEPRLGGRFSVLCS